MKPVPPCGRYVDGRHSCTRPAAQDGRVAASFGGVPARFKHHFERWQAHSESCAVHEKRTMPLVEKRIARFVEVARDAPTHELARQLEANISPTYMLQARPPMKPARP